MKLNPLRIVLLALFALHYPSLCHAMEMNMANDPTGCSSMTALDISMNECMPFPMAGMPMSMLMLHGNAFGTWITEQGPRGRDALASPNFVMADIGTSAGDYQYLNVDFMGTAELWTFPANGYPLLMQIGETNAQGLPYIDAQHPHSSPVMGLTFSDTIRLGPTKDHFKLFFAPRGESTDGPIAFMHRPTGMVNPDAPLGHHIGQDVGHITSTVFGGGLQLGGTRYEVSTFNGTEPDPTKIDLPLGALNSGALRVIHTFSPELKAMGSFAYVQAPEPNEPDITYELRYSASVYEKLALSPTWTLDNALIFGAITQYDHAASLLSVTEEFLFSAGAPHLWGRIEILERTPSELAIPVADGPNTGRWVAAFTLGYTHLIARVEDAVDISVGGSATKSVLPGEFIGTYGGDPWSGKVFLQVGGMKMWEF